VCSKEGWQKGKDHVIELELPVDVTNKDGSNGLGQPSENKVKSKRRRSLTREGCMACCTFKRNTKGKYENLTVHEGHNHPLPTRSKIPMLKSTREVFRYLKMYCVHAIEIILVPQRPTI